MTAHPRFTDILDVIDTLRSPDGCPWDRVQTKEDLGRYLRDEVYEVLDAIKKREPDELKEELGDALFQIFFLMRIAEESREFTIDDVIKTIVQKMVRRHPHVFGTASAPTIEAVRERWKEIKAEEKGTAVPASLFDDIPQSLSPLTRAQALSERASTVGFDWREAQEVVTKIEEEMGELKRAVVEANRDSMTEEMGDLFFSLVNLSRFLSIDAELALVGACGKFEKRFSFIEKTLKERGKTPAEASCAEMDDLWSASKKRGAELE